MMRHTALPVISKYSLTVLALAIRFHNLNRKVIGRNALEVSEMGMKSVAVVSLLKSYFNQIQSVVNMMLASVFCFI